MRLFYGEINYNNKCQNNVTVSNFVRQTGCVVLVFAIGTVVGWDELHGIASDPDQQTVFSVDSYDHLDTILDPLASATADGQ